MLAYVFWHWPQAAVDRQTYESRLVDFQKALAAHPPGGFRQSAVFRLSGAPWLPAAGYEEWYATHGSAALDPLNDAAVSPACRSQHDAVARLAGGGAAGLYRFRAGEQKIIGARHACWFGKPDGTSYADFYSLLEPLTRRPGVALWGRQMVLGPTPEFCLLASSPVDLPAGLSGTWLTLAPVWP